MIYITHGDKGGVGKSTVAHAIANVLLEKKAAEKPIFIDLDTSNPDVGAMYQEEKEICETRAFDPVEDYDRAEFQSLIIKCLKETPDRDILINFGAKSQKDTMLLSSMLRHIKPMVFWVIDANPTGFELLERFLNEVGEMTVCAIANEHFGPRRAFHLFEQQASNVPMVYFPKMSPITREYMTTRRIPIHHWNPDSSYEDKMPIDHWWESEKWVIDSGMAIKTALKKATPVSKLIVIEKKKEDN